jgi:glycosyltransferase involved in cell wall biosynthesis
MRWDSIIPLRENWHLSKEIKPFRDELAELINKNFSGRQLWGWKDPRNSILLPLWEDVLWELGIELSCIIAVRNPIDVARSHEKRNGFSYERSIGLWYDYNTVALRVTSRLPRTFIRYDRLVDGWESELKRCARELDIGWPEDPSLLKERMDVFIRPDIRHSSSSMDELRASNPPALVIQLMELLESDATTPERRASFDKESGDLASEFPTYAHIFAWDRNEFGRQIYALEKKQEALLETLRKRESRISALEEIVGEVENLRGKEEELSRIHGSRGWRTLLRFYRLRDRLLPLESKRRRAAKFIWNAFKKVKASAIQHTGCRFNSEVENNSLYAPHALDATGENQLNADIAKFKLQPKISIVMPTYNTRPDLLKVAIDSVRGQIYKNWELCIVDDCSTNEETKAFLKDCKKDNRIKAEFLTKNLGISEASNSAINMAAGDFIALMDHDDEITPDALYWVVKEINEDAEVDIIYTDECKVDEKGGLSDFFYKPDWSPELLINRMYVGHLTVYRKDFLQTKVGYFRKEFDFSQDYDLMLRAVEKTSNIRHIKKILYHWRITEGSATYGDKPFARQTNLAALRDSMKRRNIDADIIGLPAANRAKIKFDEQLPVSIIIPTDSFNNLKDSIESIVQETTYKNYEIVVVTNSELIGKMEHKFSLPNLIYAPYDLPYNFSDKCNQGTKYANGEILIFYNDDVRPLEKDWIENTIEFLFVPGVGGVSPKLIYKNDTIQYAGMATGVRNLLGTTFHCYHKDSIDYVNFPQLVRNVSILTGACLAIKKSLFIELGGFDSVNTPSAHSDVDISFKILDKNLRCVYTPYAVLRHIGHASLKKHKKKHIPNKDKADIFLMRNWMKYLSEDAYFTDPMRSLLYHDSVEPFKVYAPIKSVRYGNKGDIILISHDLSRSGAPINLYDTCKMLISNGYFVVVASPTDGPLREMYRQIGVPVIVDDLLLKQHDSLTCFAKNFDFALCNTIVTWPVVKQLEDVIKTIWWIQEAQAINLFTVDKGCVKTLKKARHIIGLSDYAFSYLKTYNPNVTKIYNASYDIYDEKKVVLPKTNNKIILSIVGSIEPRKGQDILVDSLNYIDNNILEKIQVWIIGRTLDAEFRKILIEKTGNKNMVQLKGEVPHTECLTLINQSDVILNTSRDEPLSVALVEAFCLAKPCLVSTNTGIAELINHGENGFVFEHEDPHDLSDKITLITKNANKLKEIGLNARKTYLQHLTMEMAEKKWLQYIEGL